MGVNLAELQANLAELRRRRPVKKDDFLSDLTAQQRAMVDDPAPLVAVLGTRRCGKSRSFIRKMIETARDQPGSTQFYINESRNECDRIAWTGNPARGDGLKSICVALGVGEPNEQKMRMTFHEWGGSYIECIGADDEKAVQKLLGSSPHRVWVDEAQKMPAIIKLIQDVVDAAMADFDGQVVMTGTPNEYCSGYFYEVTREDPDADVVRGWSIHRISVLDNPFFGNTREERYDRVIKPRMERYGWKGDEPRLLRDWYGKWVKSDAKFVYAVHRVSADKLYYDGTLPEIPPDVSWRHVIGFDLGYDPDPFAWVVWAWHDRSPDLWEVESGKEGKLTPKRMAEAAAELIERYQPEAIVGDAGGLGKAIVHGWAEEWHDRFGLPVEEAEKANKEQAIAMYNGEVEEGRVHLVRGGLLAQEQETITWLPQKRPGLRRREDPAKPNDVADAGLYSYRLSLHHRWMPEQARPAYGSEAYNREIESDIEEQILVQLAEDEAMERDFA